MISRLAATLLLLATLGACSGPKPVAKAPEVKAPPAAPASPAGYTAAKSPTLDAVRKRGYVRCGVHAGLPGFALKDARGAQLDARQVLKIGLSGKAYLYGSVSCDDGRV